MVNNQVGEKLMMIDSCVLIEILLHGKLFSECQDFLRLKKDEGFTPCISLEILYEIIGEINVSVKEEVENRNACINFEKEKRRMILSHLSILYGLVSPGKIFSRKDGEKPSIIFKECNQKLRISGKRGDWDKIHIATAIVNGCCEFVTLDNGIYEERSIIRGLSKGVLEVIKI